MRTYPFLLADEIGMKVMKVENQFASNQQVYSAAIFLTVMVITQVAVHSHFGTSARDGEQQNCSVM
jgi:hypothetical protein